MNEALQKAIEGMMSPDLETRVLAATEIYRQGRSAADHATYPWWADAELKELLEGHSPKVTIGLAVTPENFEKIHEAYGSPHLAEVPPDQDVREFELHLPGGLSMDILTTKDLNGNGAIANYLRKLGEGIQQIEYLCKDVDRATEILKETFETAPVYPATRPGADGTRVNFFLVPSPDAGKVLIELYEAALSMD